MASYQICLIGQHQPLTVDMPYTDIDDLLEAASRSKFLAGTMADGDEDGVCRRVMIATNRIQCAFEAG